MQIAREIRGWRIDLREAMDSGVSFSWTMARLYLEVDGTHSILVVFKQNTARGFVERRIPCTRELLRTLVSGSTPPISNTTQHLTVANGLARLFNAATSALRHRWWTGVPVR